MPQGEDDAGAGRRPATHPVVAGQCHHCETRDEHMAPDEPIRRFLSPRCEPERQPAQRIEVPVIRADKGRLSEATPIKPEREIAVLLDVCKLLDSIGSELPDDIVVRVHRVQRQRRPERCAIAERDRRDDDQDPARTAPVPAVSKATLCLAVESTHLMFWSSALRGETRPWIYTEPLGRSQAPQLGSGGSACKPGAAPSSIAR